MVKIALQIQWVFRYLDEVWIVVFIFCCVIIFCFPFLFWVHFGAIDAITPKVHIPIVTFVTKFKNYMNVSCLAVPWWYLAASPGGHSLGVESHLWPWCLFSYQMICAQTWTNWKKVASCLKKLLTRTFNIWWEEVIFDNKRSTRTNYKQPLSNIIEQTAQCTNKEDSVTESVMGHLSG